MTLVARSVPVMIVATVACGPSSEEPARRTCGGDEPVQLFSLDEDEWYVEPTIAGENVVASLWGITGGRIQLTYTAFATDLCGGSAVELVAETTKVEEEVVGTVGSWVLAVPADGGVMRWVDADGVSPSHDVFPSAHTCVLEVADGLAVVDSEGTAWFNADPGDPSVVPVAIAHDLIRPEFPSFFADFSRCWNPNGDVPVVDGDGLLVAETDGPLVRISLPSGQRETIIHEPVGQFVVLEDPRYILWRGGNEYSSDVGCCDLYVRDRDTGEDLRLGGGTLPGAAHWESDWISTTQWGAFDPDGETTTFLQVDTATTRVIDGWWNLEARLSASRLLLSRVGTDVSDNGTHVLDIPTGRLAPVDFPPPPWNAPKYPDGVVGFAAEPDATIGVLELLPFDETGVELLAKDVHTPWLRTQRGTIVFVERAEAEADTGVLVYIREGRRHVVDTDVRGFTIPFYGTDEELAEVLYDVHDPARAGLWRFVLP